MASEISDYHKHEMLDRSHTLEVMFDELIVDHPAAVLLEKEIEQAQKALARLYQRAGEVGLE